MQSVTHDELNSKLIEKLLLKSVLRYLEVGGYLLGILPFPRFTF